MNEVNILENFAGKRVLFITTHGIDYIRNVQHVAFLRENGADVKCVYSNTGNHMLSALKIFFVLLFSPMKDVDVVFVSYMCQLVVPVLPVFGRKLKKKVLVVDFFISLYDSLVFDRQKIGEGNPLARVLHWLDAASLRKADRVIVDTKAHGGYFCREFGVPKEKLEVVYLKADTSVYYPRKMEKKPEFRGKYLVVYFATVIPLQGMDIVLEAVRLLRKHGEIHFCIIGPVEKRCRKVVSDTVTYIGWLQQSELAEYIAMADLCLAGHFHGTIMKAKRTIPGKAYIYEAMGKPMVLGDSPANHERYSENQPGIYFVPMGDGKALAKKILEVCRNDKTVDHSDCASLSGGGVSAAVR